MEDQRICGESDDRFLDTSFGPLASVIINALESHGVEPSYVRVLENIYHDAESNIKILDDLTPVTIKRGVRQGCVLSPLLFNAVLEQVFNSLQWDEKHEYSIGINGDRLTNLRYADDIALIAHDRDTMQKMVDELIQESKKVGLVINKKKNVAMTNLPTTSPDNLNIKINGQNINIVDKFIYLGSSVSFDSNNNEIQRRISSAWGAFTKHRQFLTDRRAVPRLKKGVFMTCVVPCFLYGCEAGALRIEEKRKIDVARRRMERAMLGISRLDRIRNVEIAKRTFAECNRTVVEKKSKLGMEGCQRGRKKMVT
ncbi:hypothetical protein B9Z55_028821 [Caenorhabditis nigoni]|uniref:Reverse transcriptase domain-containing protein n=1 Tax=Caenorhabditis nigoni TaxID=1611254 RepID=A0A2G5SA86_9PELO|nr:hypothetical protein B9Z55_028821 [Caenorhabditis nigoni]